MLQLNGQMLNLQWSAKPFQSVAEGHDTVAAALRIEGVADFEDGTT